MVKHHKFISDLIWFVTNRQQILLLGKKFRPCDPTKYFIHSGVNSLFHSPVVAHQPTYKPVRRQTVKQLLEWSGMWIVIAGIVIVIVGIVVLIATEDSWILYATGYVVAIVGALLLLWVVLRDRLRARKTDDLDDVGFN